jgi:hypothetical protein
MKKQSKMLIIAAEDLAFMLTQAYEEGLIDGYTNTNNQIYKDLDNKFYEYMEKADSMLDDSTRH